jgi:hypothetical protein
MPVTVFPPNLRKIAQNLSDSMQYSATLEGKKVASLITLIENQFADVHRIRRDALCHLLPQLRILFLTLPSFSCMALRIFRCASPKRYPLQFRRL